MNIIYKILIIICIVILIIKIIKECFDRALNKSIARLSDTAYLKKKLNLFDKSIYDNVFDEKTRDRGMYYYSENKIKNFDQKNNLYTCEIIENDTYNVSLEFDDYDNIISSSCSCPYYINEHKNCKHIYALLIKAKCEDNQAKIINEINKYLLNLSKIINNYMNSIKKNKNNLNKNNVKNTQNLLDSYHERISFFMEITRQNKFNEDSLMDILKKLIEENRQMQKNMNKAMIELNSTFHSTKTHDMPDIEEKVEIKKINKNQEKYDKQLEEEMNYFDLDEEEKEEVRSGMYTPEDFDMDYDDKDNYYNEDDDKPEE